MLELKASIRISGDKSKGFVSLPHLHHDIVFARNLRSVARYGKDWMLGARDGDVVLFRFRNLVRVQACESVPTTRHSVRMCLVEGVRGVGCGRLRPHVPTHVL